MFKLAQSPTYTWTVTLEVPVSGNRTEKHTFDAEFKRLPQSRVEEIGQQLSTGELTDSALAREVVVGWSGVFDDSEPVPFSQSALNQMLEIHGMATAIGMAFLNSIYGAKRKN